MKITMESTQHFFPRTSLLLVFYRFSGWRKILLCSLFMDIPVDAFLFVLLRKFMDFILWVFPGIPRAQSVVSHVASALYSTSSSLF